MEPVLNGLNIYEDSNIRQELAFIHIKQEVTIKEEQQRCRSSIDEIKTKLSLRSSNASQDLSKKGIKLRLGS